MTRQASSTAVATALVVGVSLASYFVYCRHKSQQPRNTLGDLRGNFYATGTDVCRLYRKSVPGLVVVVTGTSSGLGAQTAKLLGTHGAFVILGNRQPNNESNQTLATQIQQAGGQALSLRLDLASFASVRSFADRVKQTLHDKNRKLNVLLHNAGVSFLNGTTEDGHQRVWQVNALAPALLTELLLPVLCPETGRVVAVSSEMHRFCFGQSIVEKCPPNPKTGKSSADYALSKACQVLQALELTHRAGNNSVRGFAIEPGLVRTNIGRHAPRWVLEVEYFLLGPFFLRTVDQGCASTLLCALAPLSDLGGGNKENKYKPFFYFANCAPKTPKANATSLEEAQRLRRLCSDIWKTHLP